MELSKKRAIIFLSVFVVLTLFLFQQPQSDTSKTETVNLVQPNSSENAENLILASETTVKEICVHVAGAVKNPGVYELHQGQRIEDAIQKAGLLADADADALNRAAILSDGQKIVVPFISDAHTINEQDDLDAAAHEHNSQGDKINLNQATIAELMELPGIGEVKAGAIVQYRQEHDGFQSVDELLLVSGIGTATYARLAELVSV